MVQRCLPGRRLSLVAGRFGLWSAACNQACLRGLVFGGAVVDAGVRVAGGEAQELLISGRRGKHAIFAVDGRDR